MDFNSLRYLEGKKWISTKEWTYSDFLWKGYKLQTYWWLKSYYVLFGFDCLFWLHNPLPCLNFVIYIYIYYFFDISKKNIYIMEPFSNCCVKLLTCITAMWCELSSLIGIYMCWSIFLLYEVNLLIYSIQKKFKPSLCLNRWEMHAC